MNSRPSFNEGGEDFSTTKLYYNEKLLQDILYLVNVNKMCLKCDFSKS